MFTNNRTDNEITRKEYEIISIIEPILQDFEKVEDDEFELPDVNDLDSFLTAKLLYESATLE